MSNFELIKSLNPNIKMFKATDKEFLKFGRIINAVDTSKLIRVAEEIKMPENGSVYNPSQTEFESIEGLNKDYSQKIYGEMPVQIGFCYGFNSFLNGLEWHKGNEINVAVTDFVLLLGSVYDINNGEYNSSNVEGFFIEKGTSVEIFQSTLHFCPAQVSENGFRSVVVLPSKTNLPLENKAFDKFLFRKNKWIISHIENTSLIEKGVYGGIFGENYCVKY